MCEVNFEIGSTMSVISQREERRERVMRPILEGALKCQIRDARQTAKYHKSLGITIIETDPAPQSTPLVNSLAVVLDARRSFATKFLEPRMSTRLICGKPPSMPLRSGSTPDQYVRALV